MGAWTEREKLLRKIGFRDEDTLDPCHRCKLRTDVESFILAGKRLRRHKFPAQLRWYILAFVFWLYWPSSVLFLTDFLVQTLGVKASHQQAERAVKKGLALVRRKFAKKRVLNHRTIGKLGKKASSSKSVTKNPKARWDGLDMCRDMLAESSSIYTAAGRLAENFTQQYRGKRSVSVAQLTIQFCKLKVPGFREASQYSTIRLVRSLIFQELPSCQQPFRDTEADWRKWRRMGKDQRYLRKLGVWNYSGAMKLRDRVAVAERRLCGAKEVERLGKYSLADLRCFICLAPNSIAAKPAKRKRYRGTDDRVRPGSRRKRESTEAGNESQVVIRSPTMA